MLPSSSGLGRSSSMSTLPSKNGKFNPLKNTFTEIYQGNDYPLNVYTTSDDVLKGYIYGSGKKKRNEPALEYTLPMSQRGTIY